MKKDFKEIMEKRNAAFQALSSKGKRIAIARDVIKHLDAKVFTAHAGAYVTGFTEYTTGIGYGWKIPQDSEICEQMESSDWPGCEVCALGAVLLAHAYHTDDLSVGSAAQSDSGPIKERMSGFFEEDQLSLIEAAFERSYAFAVGADGALEAENFGEGFDDPDERLRAIMQKIASHPEGLFVP